MYIDLPLTAFILTDEFSACTHYAKKSKRHCNANGARASAVFENSDTHLSPWICAVGSASNSNTCYVVCSACLSGRSMTMILVQFSLAPFSCNTKKHARVPRTHKHPSTHEKKNYPAPPPHPRAHTHTHTHTHKHPSTHEKTNSCTPLHLTPIKFIFQHEFASIYLSEVQMF